MRLRSACAWMAAISALSVSASAHAQVFSSLTSFSAASGPASYVETFESVPVDKDTPVASFSQGGITYLGLAGSPDRNVVVASPGATSFAPGLTPTSSSVLTAQGDEFFLLSFDTPLAAVGFNFYSNGSGPVSVFFLTGSDLTDMVVADSYLYVGPATLGYVGYVAPFGAPVSAVVFNTTGGAAVDAGIDNLSIERVGSVATPVPEPASWALAVAGLTLLSNILRTRRPLR